MSAMSDDQETTVTGELVQLKVSLLKATIMAVQAIGFLLGAGAIAYGATGEVKAALMAGLSSAGGYVVGNLQKTGGVNLTLKGLQK